MARSQGTDMETTEVKLSPSQLRRKVSDLFDEFIESIGAQLVFKFEDRDLRGKTAEEKQSLMREYCSSSMARCAGVYIQLRRRSVCYIGEAVDIASRQLEHLNNGVEVIALAIVRMRVSDVGMRFEHETKLITRALRLGLPLANKSKVKMVEKELKEETKISLENAHTMLDAVNSVAVRGICSRGWVSELEEAKRNASAKDWERYINFHDDTPWALARLLIGTFVRRVIDSPEENYGKTWCIEMNDTGFPGSPWVWVQTVHGRVFELSAETIEERLVLWVKIAIDFNRWEVFFQRHSFNNEAMRYALGITVGVFDLVEALESPENDTAMKVDFETVNGKPSTVYWTLDPLQALEMMASTMGVALLMSGMKSITKKRVRAKFGLGKVLF